VDGFFIWVPEQAVDWELSTHRSVHRRLGVDHGIVIGIIAGGDRAIRYPVEFAEDNKTQGWLDLEEHSISSNDVVIGIAASGSTPYVFGCT
jgi:N-acetylmuramic acid 6-phosphate (MurNAc-6-P) etherase